MKVDYFRLRKDVLNLFHINLILIKDMKVSQMLYYDCLNYKLFPFSKNN